MATVDCNNAHSLGLRRYPQVPDCAYRQAAGSVSYLAVREPDNPTADEILGRFSDARCFLECAVQSLMAREGGSNAGPELVCLHYGLDLLRTVYNDLDVDILGGSLSYRAGRVDPHSGPPG